MVADAPAGAKGQPQFLDAGAPDIAVDPNLVADYAALVGNRKVGTTAQQDALAGDLVWEGLLFGNTTDGTERRFTAAGAAEIIGGLKQVLDLGTLTLASGWSFGAGSFIEKRGDVGTLHLSLLRTVGITTLQNIFTIPTGFRPVTDYAPPLSLVSGANPGLGFATFLTTGVFGTGGYLTNTAAVAMRVDMNYRIAPA